MAYLQAPTDQTEALALCGFMSADCQLREPNDNIPAEDYEDDEGSVPSRADENSEMSEDERQIIGCDGSAYNPGDDRLRRAAYGVWFGHDHSRDVEAIIRD